MKPLAFAILLLLALLSSGCYASMAIQVTGEQLPPSAELEEIFLDAGTIWGVDVYRAEPGDLTAIEMKVIPGFQALTVSEEYPRGTCGRARYSPSCRLRSIKIDPECLIDSNVFAHELGHALGVRHASPEDKENVMHPNASSRRWGTTEEQRETAQNNAYCGGF